MLKGSKNKNEKKQKKNVFICFKKEFFQRSTFSMFEVLILILISIVFGVWIGYIITYHRNPLDRNISEIVSTYHNIIDEYYDKVDSNKLADAAVKGMMNSLGDPYSSYMDEGDTSSFQDQINGSFIGIGVTVVYEESGYHRVIEVLPKGPADKAGIKANDIIIKVNGKSVKDVTGTDFTKIIRGKKGEKLTLTINRDENEFEVILKRDIIEIDSVSSEVIDFENKKIGYLKIDSFASNTSSQFTTNLEKLEKNNIDGLVIDVRDNHGGYLLQVQKILSSFFPKKTLLYQIQSKNVKKKIKSVSNDSRNYPIAVLINGDSASASEVLASCFQEVYDKSVIVGETSYGKGTVQKPRKLSSGSSIKYTTQKWLTAKGKNLEGKGVTPDVIVKQNEEYYNNPSQDMDYQLQEALIQLKKSID